MDYKEKIPKNIIDVLLLLEEAGFRAYVVGGAVRDILRGESPSDFDVTTNATPNEGKQVFSSLSVYETGIKHGTLTVISGDEPVEVTTFRTDGEYTDSRHPESVKFTDKVEDDLSRRDFTVNAMAMGRDGKIIDPYGGVDDLERGLIRAVGDPEVRFTEDALRIMRCFRFSSKLGFEIDEKTLEAAQKLANRLSAISKERITAELEKLLLGEYCSKGLILAKEAGVLDVILPGNKLTTEFAKNVGYITDIFANRLAAVLKDVPLSELSSVTERLALRNKDKSTVRNILTGLDFLVNDDDFSPRVLAYECLGNTFTVAKIAHFSEKITDGEMRKCLAAYLDPNLPRKRSDLKIAPETLITEFGCEKELVGGLLSLILEEILQKRCKNEPNSIAVRIPAYITQLKSDDLKYGKEWRRLRKYSHR